MFTFLVSKYAVIIPPGPTTVLDVVVNSPDHTTLESLVIAAGLDDELASAGPFTVFAPTDAAFAALPEEVVSSLTADPTGACISQCIIISCCIWCSRWK